MNTRIGILFAVLGLCVLPPSRANSQEKPALPDITLRRAGTTAPAVAPVVESPTRYRISGKRASQYTSEDWGALIDTTWGPGQSAAAQLNVFDTFWNTIDRQWAGFPNLSVNWDSLRSYYRPQIGSGLSRGRFYSLMSRLWLAVLEHHTWLLDRKLDSIYGAGPQWNYKSGVPLLVIGTAWWDLLGAAVTAMPDSSGLVYRVEPGNPLGLQPGDLVLGYEGIPWKRLFGQLLDAGLPVSRVWGSPGSNPESRSHNILSAVGWNWGLFDTIDVVKYSTGDTLHLPTAPLATLSKTIWASEQVPVPGVPMPQAADGSSPTVSYGVVEGTNIGYVYVWDWYTAGTSQLFSSAIHDLVHVKNVAGLIIDFRMNWGGDPSFSYGGFSQLFNASPTTGPLIATRNDIFNHFAFHINTTSTFPSFTPAVYPFDHPIAVLIGPACLSAGDYTAFWMRSHPMARFFGKPTDGAFVGGTYITGTIPDAWPYQVPASIGYSSTPAEGYLIHKGVQPDEDVWLTRDGVAKGEDDVVKRAIEWISTLLYAHDIRLSRQTLDTILVTARVENPLGHSLTVVARLNNGSGSLIDSLLLADDGLHGDSASADGLWGCRYVPLKDDSISISIRTTDQTAGSSRTLPNVLMYLFTRRALISVDTRSVELGAIGRDIAQFDTSFWVRNDGYTSDSVFVSVDPVNVVPDYAVSAFPDTFRLAARDSQKVTFRITPNLLGVQYYQAVAIVESQSAFGQTRFEKNYLFHVVPLSVPGSSEIPTAYSLEQNYPNPFNPTTTLRYGLPQRSSVLLRIFNALGQQVAIVEQGEQQAGYHESRFDGTGLSSGVYFCRLQAGEYVATKKLLLIR